MGGFDKSGFMSASFEPATASVEVPEMADFFGDGADAIFTVRGLNANEFYTASTIEQRKETITSVVSSLSTSAQVTEKLKDVIGLTGENTPAEVDKRIYMLATASISPKLETFEAGKIAEVYPISFFNLTTEIAHLTGQGATVKKS